MHVIESLILALELISLASADSSKCQHVNKLTGNLQRLDCVLDPGTIQGPYYLPLNISRSVIHEGHPGIIFNFNIVIMDTAPCEPVPNAVVDIWHANGSGIYSGFDIEGTAGETYCRGIQLTNLDGEVSFETIYPGWYVGRSIHFHIEVFVGGSLKHTGQIYFQDSLTEHVRHVWPYVNIQAPLTWNTGDRTYQFQGGAETTLEPTGYIDTGLAATMYVGIDQGSDTATTTNRPIFV